MALELIVKEDNEKRLVDLSLNRELTRELINQEEYEGNLKYLGNGADSVVFSIGNTALKIYCNQGYAIAPSREKYNAIYHPSIDTLRRYKKLTSKAKQILEKNPPKGYSTFKTKDGILPVQYKVIPIKDVFAGIGPNIRKLMYLALDCGGQHENMLWISEDDKVSASTQEYIQGPVLDKKKFKLSGIETEKLIGFLSDLWEYFPEIGLIHFGFDSKNIKPKMDNQKLTIHITDLASKVWQQVKYFKEGEKYSTERIKALLEEEKRKV